MRRRSFLQAILSLPFAGTVLAVAPLVETKSTAAWSCIYTVTEVIEETLRGRPVWTVQMKSFDNIVKMTFGHPINLGDRINLCPSR